MAAALFNSPGKTLLRLSERQGREQLPIRESRNLITGALNPQPTLEVAVVLRDCLLYTSDAAEKA